MTIKDSLIIANGCCLISVVLGAILMIKNPENPVGWFLDALGGVGAIVVLTVNQLV